MAKKRRKKHVRPSISKEKQRRTIGPRLKLLEPYLDFIGVIITVFVFIGHLFFTDECFVGSGTDMVSAVFPKRAFVAQWWATGVFPLWNPFIFGGVPFQTGIHGFLYPGLWTGALLPTALDIKIGIGLHLAIAAVGAVWFSRRFVSSQIASYFCGVVFSLSGFTVSHLYAGHPVLIATTAYLPWMAGALDRLVTGDRRHVLTGIIIAGLMVLSAHYHMIFIGMGGILLFLLLRELVEKRGAFDTGKAALRRVGSVLIVFGALMLSGMLIASVQIISMLDTMSMSHRASGSFEFAASYSSAPVNVLTYLMPNLFGNYVDVFFIGDWAYWESLGYIGIVPCVWLLAGLSLLPPRRWIPPMAMVILGLILSFGAHTPLFKAYLAVIPGADLFRSPGRFCIWVTLFGSLLAAQSLDAWYENAALAKRRLVTPILGAVLALGILVLALVTATKSPSDFAEWIVSMANTPSVVETHFMAWPALMTLVRSDAVKAITLLSVASFVMLVGARRAALSKRFAAVLVAVTVADLYHFGHRFLITAKTESFELPKQIAEIVKNEGGPAVRMLYPPESRWQDYGMVHGIGNPGGHDSFVINRHMRYLNRAGGAPLDEHNPFARTAKGSPLIRHLGPEFLLAQQPLSNGRNRTAAGYDWFKPYKRVGSLHLYRDEDVPPRATLVHRVEVIEDEEKTYRRMLHSDFDIRDTVLVETELPPGFPPPRPKAVKGPEKCSITRYEVNRVELDVEAASDAVLVLSDAHSTGWRAYVDDREVPLIHANRVMRALPVPSGRHRVTMSYLPTPFLIGAGLSALFIAGLLAAFFFRKRWLR